MGLLNSGTLNRGRNLCVTVAVDHLTVDGFHEELQLSAKNTKGKALRRSSSVKEFYLVRWNEYHFSAAFNLLKFHQFGSTVLPETLLEYVWYVGGEVWKGTLMVADLEQVVKNRRVRILQHKSSTRRRWSRPTWWQHQKKRTWTIEIYWRRSCSENSNLEKVPSKFEEKFKKTFLENQTGFHNLTKQEIIAHQHSLYKKQRYPHQNCFGKYLGKLVMNFFIKQTYAVCYR